MTTRDATRAVCIAALLLALAPFCCFSQSAVYPQSTTDYGNPRSTLNDHPQRNTENDPAFAALATRARHIHSEDRQRHLQEETARILALITTLNQNLQQHAALTDEDRRILQEIERLTRDAKRWMRE